MGKRVVIAGEVYSPNLGDGIIFETMRYIYGRVDPNVEVRPLDISGRQGWNAAQTPAGYRLKAIGWARRHTGWVYARLNALRLELDYRRSLRQRWRQELAGTDALVLGGGQLLMDDHLDFPTKLNQLSRLAKESDLPLHLSACGVGASWSRRGKRLVEEVLSQAASITLRDGISQCRMESIFPGYNAERTADPAIWAAELYGKGRAGSNKTLGLGVLNLADVNLRNPGRRLAQRELEGFWLDLIARLEYDGVECELFSNGNLADEAFGRRLAAIARKRKGLDVRMASRPARPAELANRVREYGEVVAFRLHAALLAVSYGVPCVGLGWDEKVPALFEELQLPENCFGYGEWNATAVAGRIMELMRGEMAYRQVEQLKALALRNVQIVLG